MQSIEDIFLLNTCKIRFFVVILPSAFQAERMFPLYIYSTTHTAKHKKDEPARIHPLCVILCIVTAAVREAAQCRS